MHVTYAALQALPVYALIPSVYTLLFCQSLVIAAAGLPFYYIARRILNDPRSAILMTVAFLFYPTVATMHVDQLHWEHWSLLYLLGAVYFLLEERFWPFAICSLLGMTGQENLPMTVGMFGVYAAIKRYRLKWILTPIGLAVVYEWFALKIVLPHYMSGHAYAVTHYFGTLGNTPGAMLQTAMIQPWKVLGPIFDLEHGTYLIKMLQPVLWIAPLFTWEFLLAVPSLGLNLIMPEASFRVIPWHYNPTSGAFLCLVAVFGVKRIAEIMVQRWGIGQGRLWLSFTIAVLSLSSWPLWFNLNEYIPHTYFPVLQKAAEVISPEKSVVAPVSMLGHFAERETPVHQWQFNPNNPFGGVWPREKLYEMDYIILDGNEHRFPDEIVTRDLVISFYTNTNYELILNNSNVFVFRRRASVSFTR